MANNRLFIGNKKTKKVFCISKPDDNDKWRRLQSKELKGLNDIITTENIWCKETDLVFFTESDDIMFNYFFRSR